MFTRAVHMFFCFFNGSGFAFVLFFASLLPSRICGFRDSCGNGNAIKEDVSCLAEAFR